MILEAECKVLKTNQSSSALPGSPLGGEIHLQTWGRIPGKSMQMCLSRLSSHAGPWAPRWSLPKAQLLFQAQGLLGRQRHHRKQGASVTDGWFGIKSGGPQLEREKHKYTLQVLRSGPRWVSAFRPWGGLCKQHCGCTYNLVDTTLLTYRLLYS